MNNIINTLSEQTLSRTITKNSDATRQNDQKTDVINRVSTSIEHFTRTYQDKIDRDKALNRPERTVLKAICYYAESKGVCYLNHQTAMAKAGYSKAQFIRILNQLIEKRFIWSIHTTKPSGHRATNTYLINWPQLGIHKFNNLSLVTLYNLRYDHKLCQTQLDIAYSEYHQQLKPAAPSDKAPPEKPENEPRSHCVGDVTGLPERKDINNINMSAVAEIVRSPLFDFCQKRAEQLYTNSSQYSQFSKTRQESYRQYQTNQYRIALRAIIEKTKLPIQEVGRVIDYLVDNEWWSQTVRNGQLLADKFMTIHRQMYGNYVRAHCYNKKVRAANPLKFAKTEAPEKKQSPSIMDLLNDPTFNVNPDAYIGEEEIEPGVFVKRA